MKISNRELTLGIGTIALVLFGITYWVGGDSIAEQRKMAAKKAQLHRQIKFDKRILEEKETWIGRLDTLQDQLPVYTRQIQVNIELPKKIRRIADQHRLNFSLIQPEGSEEKIGSLYELKVRCDWQGDLNAIVHFLHELHAQGIRFDVRQISIKPVAKQEEQLKGSMIINCAYRRAEENQ
jgi:hypothetical protein